jgi:hypothetical protein
MMFSFVPGMSKDELEGWSGVPRLKFEIGAG